MFDKLEIFDKRFEELNKRMYEPDVAADPVTFREVNKELSSITPIVEKYREYKNAKKAVEDALSLLEDSTLDDEMKDFLRAEFAGECSEVGMYLAMSRAAIREGYPEVGAFYRQAAFEEADHASRYAEMLGEVVSAST